MIAWLAFAFGISGALLVAYKKPLGWFLFLCSNAAWISFALETRNMPLLAQMACFTITSAIGLRNSLATKTSSVG